MDTWIQKMLASALFWICVLVLTPDHKTSNLVWPPHREKAEEYERSILLHLRQISLYDSPERMVGFMESVLVEGYLDRQPDLLSTLYDELDLERPVQLRQLFSPTGQPPSYPHSIMQCCGSMSFWGGSGYGSADQCLWLIDPDPDTDPAIFVIDLPKMPTKN